nr:gliding motility-associated C-terminal domain-containing protein [Bacteroidota bacterium]
YLWSNGNATSAASGLCSGLYTVDITDSSGCVTSVSIPVSNTSGPASITFTSTNVSCFGICDGAVTAATPVGGLAPYTLLWIHNGATTAALSSMCAGTYYLQATDANGCSVTDSVTITEPSQLITNQSVTAATCGVCDGSITIAPSGGTPPYTVLWNTGSTSLALNSLCAGVYSVVITDATGCSQNSMIPVNNFTAASLTMTSTDVTCDALCNGSASVSATGGLAPYAYLWNDVSAQTNDTASGLCAGTYFVEVTGADGCVSIASVIIDEPTPIGFSVSNTIEPLCNGNSNGSITAIPSGGTLPYSYSWAPAGGSAATATGLPANTYTVTVIDANGCSSTQTIILTSPTVLTISSTTTPSSCNTIPDGAIDVTVGGGTLPYAYQWSGGSTAVTEDLSGVLSGSYTITVTDSNNCTVADTIILTANTTVIAVAGNDTTFCENGAIALNAAGSTNAVNFQWFQLPGNTPLGSTANISLTPSNGITAYYVTVDNGTGCFDSDTINVTSNPLPNVNAGVDVTIVIGGSSSIGGTPTTSTPGATLVWTPLPGLDNSTIQNPVANPVTTTTYTVTVTSAQGCVSIDSMVVTVLPTIFIPNGISPNADGANDEWVIDGIELFPDCIVEVYNRWGELLFQSPGYKEKLNVTFKGKLFPVGTYYFIIDLRDPLFPDAYTGPITLMR